MEVASKEIREFRVAQEKLVLLHEEFEDKCFYLRDPSDRRASQGVKGQALDY